MTGRTSDQESDRATHERADAICHSLLFAVQQLDRSSPSVLRDIRENLEIEIMIDRVGGSRRRLLRMLSEYCDLRIREKERGARARPEGGVNGALRALMPARYRTPRPPDRAP